MIPLTVAANGTLTWSKLSCKPNYELRLNNQAIGTLKRQSIWSSSCYAETPDGNWTFRRSGFWGTGSEIVDSGSGQTIATYKAAWGGKGTLTFADGQTFFVHCKGLFHPVWSILGEGDQPVLQLRVREKRVELASGVVLTPDRLSLLTMFTLYCVQRAEEDAAAVAVAAAAS
jgi:hypothetical protein